jgi:hypothetical protein
MDRRLAARLTEDDRPLPPGGTDPYRRVIEELRRRQVEMATIHQRLRTEHVYPGCYSTLRRHVVRLEVRNPRGSCASRSARARKPRPATPGR